MTDSRKRMIYLLLPCVLAFAAMFLNGLFKPQFHWQVRLLESSLEPYQIEGLGEQTGPLFAGPEVRASSSRYYRCARTPDIHYVQNQLLDDKLTIEDRVTLNNGFASWVAFLAVFQIFVYILYRLKQKLGWVASIAFIFLFAIVAIALITVLGPINGIVHFDCISQIKVQAELMSMSLDGVFYPLIGAFLNSVAVVMMIKFYRLPMPINQQIEE